MFHICRCRITHPTMVGGDSKCGYLFKAGDLIKVIGEKVITSHDPDLNNVQVHGGYNPLKMPLPLPDFF